MYPPPHPQQEGKLFQLANSLKCAFAAFFQCGEQTVYTGFAAGSALIRKRRGRVKGGAIASGGTRSAVRSQRFVRNDSASVFLFFFSFIFFAHVAVRSCSKAKQSASGARGGN